MCKLLLKEHIPSWELHSISVGLQILWASLVGKELILKLKQLQFLFQLEFMPFLINWFILNNLPGFLHFLLIK